MKKIINYINYLRYQRIWKKWHKSKNIPCPVCGHFLVNGELKRYETLNQHVCDPNAESELAPTLICNNKNCKTYNKGFWSDKEDGDWFCYGLYKSPEWIQGPRLVTSYYLGMEILTDYNRKGIYVGKHEK
jgi:hypothetical protein